MLLAAAQFYKLDSQGIPAMATGFCSGLSRTSGPCGAVTGAVMAIGLITGRKSSSQSVDSCYNRVQDFLDRFKAKHKFLNCTDLLECDLSTDQGRRANARRFSNGENPVCQGLTVSAAQILQQVMESE